MSATIVPIGPATEALVAQWRVIATMAASLDDTGWAGPSVLPGWQQCDIVAHVIGTESMLAGRDVAQPEGLDALDHVHNPIGELNEKWVRHFRGRPRREVLAALDEIIAVRTGALRAMTQEQFDAPTATPAGVDTYGRFMRIRIFDCWMHGIDLGDGDLGDGDRRGCVGGPEPIDPGPTGWALDEIAASLPFVVGKRAGAPPGSRVIVDIGPPAPRTVRIEVAERASAVSGFSGGDATAHVVLGVDAVALARLVGGRRDADPDAVRIAGDTELGRTIVSRLDYVI